MAVNELFFRCGCGCGPPRLPPLRKYALWLWMNLSLMRLFLSGCGCGYGCVAPFKNMYDAAVAVWL